MQAKCNLLALLDMSSVADGQVVGAAEGLRKLEIIAGALDNIVRNRRVLFRMRFLSH